MFFLALLTAFLPPFPLALLLALLLASFLTLLLALFLALLPASLASAVSAVPALSVAAPASLSAHAILLLIRRFQFCFVALYLYPQAKMRNLLPGRRPGASPQGPTGSGRKPTTSAWEEGGLG